MGKKLIRENKRNKLKIVASIDAELGDMIQEIMEGFNIGLSKAVGDVLDFFKTEVWDKGVVPKTKEEEEKETNKIKLTEEDFKRDDKEKRD